MYESIHDLLSHPFSHSTSFVFLLVVLVNRKAEIHPGEFNSMQNKHFTFTQFKYSLVFSYCFPSSIYYYDVLNSFVEPISYVLRFLFRFDLEDVKNKNQKSTCKSSSAIGRKRRRLSTQLAFANVDTMFLI